MASPSAGTDEQTIKVLSEAKKGKSRKFAFIYKGASVLKLIAFKRGAFQAKINGAKKEGFKGKGCWGIVSGEGPALTFYLSMEDGFDRAPVKELVLKKFLFEEAQLKVKVTFEIVRELPSTSDPDDETEEPEQESAVAAAPVEPETDSDDQEDQDDQSDQEEVAVTEPDPTEFKKQLAGLMPDLKKALTAGSPLTGDLKKYAEAAQKLAKAKQFDKGIEVLDKLEGLIETALAAPAASAVADQEVEAAPLDQQEEQEAETAPPAQQEEEQEPTPVATPPPPTAKAADPAERDEQEIAAERDAHQKIIADAYRDLPDPLKFTTLDAAAGKCAKIVSENRNTVEALDAYQDLISECVQWTRSEDAKEHPDAVGTVEAMRDTASAERDATKEAIAAAAALKAKLAEDFKSRLVTLMPSIMEAQGPESPVAPEVAKLFKDVQQQGKAKDFEAGHESLDALEAKIQEAKDAAEAAAAQAEQEAAAAATAAEAEQEEAEEQALGGEEQEEEVADDEQMESPAAAPVDDRTVIFRGCSNDWQQGRKRLQKALEEVEKVLLGEYAGDELFGEARDNTREIYSIMDTLDDRLCFALDDAALDGEDNIKRAVKKARKISNEYLTFLNSDPLFNALEQDKDIPLGMKSDLTSILNSISVQIT